VSARIRTLEDSLKVRLFERGRQGHGLALSAAGRALRPHAEQLLQAVALARQAVHDIRPASGGAIQIAAVLSICTYLLPDVLKDSSRHPMIAAAQNEDLRPDRRSSFESTGAHEPLVLGPRARAGPQRMSPAPVSIGC